MNLPESILLCLFPNGLVLSRQSAMLSDGGENDEFVWSRCTLPRPSHSLRSSLPPQSDPECFSFVLAFFKQSADAFYGTPNSPGLYAAQQLLVDGGSPTSDFNPTSSQNPLLSKQAIIVLREELEYFSIPSEANKSSPGLTSGTANEALLELKRKCGVHLLQKKNIFTALQRNVNKENNVAEQHLIDMLCMR